MLPCPVDRGAGSQARVRPTFQDEAQFDRMVRIRRCRSPAPLRPVVDNSYKRQFVYVRRMQPISFRRIARQRGNRKFAGMVNAPSTTMMMNSLECPTHLAQELAYALHVRLGGDHPVQLPLQYK
jgi:hypothetical protein